ncbi:hypothetical protein M2129_000550 [Polynucleobacter sphagniphilus]|nr:hypothetical protein [Polynucleobacter sphagniphilus]
MKLIKLNKEFFKSLPLLAKKYSIFLKVSAIALCIKYRALEKN